jgi:hypothetical protein
VKNLFVLSERKNSQIRTEELGRRKTQKGRTRMKRTSSMNSSDSLSLVQGPSTVTCIIVTSLSQLDHFDQFPTVGIGQGKSLACVLYLCRKSEISRKTQQ